MALNGKAKPIIFGGDGQPINRMAGSAGRGYDQYPLPHVVQFQALIGSAWQTYWHDRHDLARADSRENALAMENDIQLQGLLQERYLSTVSLEWQVKVPSERDPHQRALQQGLTTILESTPHLQKMLYGLLEAIWFGRSATQLAYEWKTMPLPGVSSSGLPGVLPTRMAMQPTRALCIKTHQPINGDSIGHKWDGTPYILANSSELSKIPGAEIVRATVSQGLAITTGSWRQRFIFHSHISKATDFWESERAEAIWGCGIRSALYWTWWLKNEWLGSVSDAVQRYGLGGIRLWYYQAGNKESKDAVEDAARNVSDKMNILVPRYENDAEGVEFVDTSVGAGADLFIKLIEYLDKGIERFIIGQTLSSDTEGSGLGGTGVASMHANTKQKIIAFDAKNLAETLTQDWLRVVQWWTFPQHRDIPARFEFSIDDPDPSERLDAIKKYFDMGGDVPESDVTGLLGLSDPQPGDKILSQAVQAKQLQQAMPPEPPQPGISAPISKSAENAGNIDEIPPAPSAQVVSGDADDDENTLFRQLKARSDGDVLLKAAKGLLPEDVWSVWQGGVA